MVNISSEQRKGSGMSPMLVESPPRLRSSTVAGRSLGLIALGGICGLAWSASLRGWMTQLAGAESSFTWTGTFLLVLLPGVLVGGLLGWGEALRQLGGRRRWQWLALAPALFLIALADPQIFSALIQTGFGGGAIGVVLVGLLGGYALAPRGPAWSRVAAGIFAMAGIAISGFMTSGVQPIATAHGAWAAVYLPSLLLVFCVACSIPHRPLPDRPDVMITRGEGDAP